MRLALCISPHGRLFIEPALDDQLAVDIPEPIATNLRAAFESDPSAGLLWLATDGHAARLPASFEYCRELAREFIAQLCRNSARDGSGEIPKLAMPDGFESRALQAPPMKGLEYLNASMLAQWWESLEACTRKQIATYPGGVDGFLKDRSPLWDQKRCQVELFIIFHNGRDST